uniref:Uncharacterized protein n=1 Tax=viral metagenome TaxID=1070528 RepID=A0A6M3L5S1_9ZZZZ
MGFMGRTLKRTENGLRIVHLQDADKPEIKKYQEFAKRWNNDLKKIARNDKNIIILGTLEKYEAPQDK